MQGKGLEGIRYIFYVINHHPFNLLANIRDIRNYLMQKSHGSHHSILPLGFFYFNPSSSQF